MELVVADASRQGTIRWGGRISPGRWGGAKDGFVATAIMEIYDGDNREQ